MTPIYAAVLIALGAAAPPASESPPTVRHQRLAALGRLWGAVRVFHPYLAYRDIDWDAALVQAVPKVSAARDEAQYVAALQSMLDALRDPATAIESGAPAMLEGTDASRNSLEAPVDGTLAVHLGGFINYQAMRDFGDRVIAELPKASAVLIDLRGLGHEEADGGSAEVGARILTALVPRPMRAPAQRQLMHSGFASQDPSFSGGYLSGFFTPLALTFVAAKDARPRRLVVLTNSQSSLPNVVLALQAAGEAKLVEQGAVGDASLVARRKVELFGGLRARVRASELTTPLDGGVLSADLQLPPGPPPRAGDEAYKAALALLQKPLPARSANKPAAALALPEGRFRYDDPYESMTAPSFEYRLLAAFRYWNAIRDFYPYLPLLDQDWDAQLPRLVALFESAEGETGYARAVAEMSALVQDCHSGVSGNAKLVDQIFGPARPPLRTRFIETQVVVTKLDETAAKESGIEVGDVILEVDGEPIAARMARLEKYVAASTPGWKSLILASVALRGPDGSSATLSLRGRSGEMKKAQLKRSVVSRPIDAGGEHYRILDRNIGYADLTKLTGDEVGPMFDRLKDTRALVFDLRGYPNGTAWQIAPRINLRKPRFAALFQRALIISAEDSDLRELRLQFMQALPLDTSGKPPYDKPTVMLVDERTISQAEHTGLFFEAAAGTRFVGSQTSGANGDVTVVVLPGGLKVWFTGHDVRHADGRQLQRVGLPLAAEVRPTLEGIRAGKDEVLERALKLLEGGK